MSRLATKWWSVQRLPSGEVELTIHPRSGHEARSRRWLMAAGGVALTFCAWTPKEPLPIVSALGVVAALLLFGYGLAAARPQVWRLKPGMAIQRAGRNGEAAFLVNEVRLVHYRLPRRQWSHTLRLVTPAKRIDVGPPHQREKNLREIGKAMAEALGVGFVEIDP